MKKDKGFSYREERYILLVDAHFTEKRRLYACAFCFAKIDKWKSA